MKKTAALIILLSNLVFSFSAGVIDANLCLVPEEYCTGDRPGDLRCDVPLGWSCGNDHNLELGIQTMTETMTITVTLPTLCDRNGSRKELESSEPTGQPTTTKETNFEEISINPKRTSKNSHAATTNSSGVSAQIGAEDWEWMVSCKTHTLSSMESAAPVQSSYTTNIHGTSTKLIDKKPPSCPEINPILEVSCVDRARLLWNDFKITWGPAWNDRPGCRRLHKEMDKRGLVTGFHCSQLADLESNTWIMEARGHRPRFPKTLVADAIRATFSADNTIYYRGYETTMLCEKARIGANLWK